MRRRQGAPMVRKKIDRAILWHLLKHPRSEDTLEGILEWWFLEQDVMRAKAEVRSALARLIGHRFVLERMWKSGRRSYRLNPEKTAELRQMRRRI